MRDRWLETITWLRAKLKKCTQLTGRYLYFSNRISFLSISFFLITYLFFLLRISFFQVKISAYKIWTFLMDIWCSLSIRKVSPCYVLSIYQWTLIARYEYLYCHILTFTKLSKAPPYHISDNYPVLCCILLKSHYRFITRYEMKTNVDLAKKDYDLFWMSLLWNYVHSCIEKFFVR